MLTKIKQTLELLINGLFLYAKELGYADVNGSLNILRKVVGEFQYPIEVCSTPLVLTIK